MFKSVNEAHSLTSNYFSGMSVGGLFDWKYAQLSPQLGVKVLYTWLTSWTIVLHTLIS